MNADLEDLLRQGIDRLPAEVPAGLTHRAARQARRHRLVTGAGVAAAAATVTAAAVVIGVLSVAPTAGKPAGTRIAQSARPAPIQHLRPLPSWPPGRITHATLVSRVEQAVLTSTNFVAYSRRYDYADRSKLIVSAWDYRNVHLLIQHNPHTAQLVTYYPDRHTVMWVDYERRTWWLTTWPFSGLVRTDKNQCVGPADDSPQVGDPRWAAWLVSSLRCGAYTVTSHSGANGTPILNIVNTPKDIEYQYGVRLHILVDATTYLPIADWQTGSYGYYDVIKWLPPTKALLARLALPVPPGFSHK
ncbi:MAG: hypothetical protein JOY82_23065 [Streptosporangiaceae bacterium]|nr:hypothetical protein [Streptosporangiaceae bacterium]MBV9857363.1 hypothetical protein [Streptosporangiaceae bacterium]